MLTQGLRPVAGSLTCGWVFIPSLGIGRKPPSPVPFGIVRDHGQRRAQEFCSGGVQQIQLRAEDRDLGAVAP